MCEWATKQQGAEELSFPTPHTQISFCKQFFYHCTWLPPNGELAHKLGYWLTYTGFRLKVTSWSCISVLLEVLFPVFFLHYFFHFFFFTFLLNKQNNKSSGPSLKHSPLLNNHKGNGQLFVKSTALLPLLSSKRECYKTKLYSREKIF